MGNPSLAREEPAVPRARILIIDDQEADILLLERMLEQAGYTEVTGITDPRLALSAFLETQPDLVLLDLIMPEVDGFTVLSRLRARIPRGDYVPILVLTADEAPEARRRALAEGAKDFLTKPFDRGEVLLRIGNLLETRLLHLRLQEHNRLLEEKVEQRTQELDENLRVLRRTDEQRRSLLARLVTAQEEERRRIALDVHDDSVQVMAAVVMRLDMLRRQALPEQVSEFAELHQTVQLAIARLRHLLFELGPPALDSEGLAPALKMYLEQLKSERGVAFRLDNALGEEPPGEIRSILYRMAQEALANVRKHARATEVRVLLAEREGGHLVRVRDNGRGFSVEDKEQAPGHLGLPSMHERAEMAGGWCRIESAPGAGTTVEFWVPASASRPWPTEAALSRTGRD